MWAPGRLYPEKQINILESDFLLRLLTHSPVICWAWEFLLVPVARPFENLIGVPAPRRCRDVATSWYYSFLLSAMEGGKASSKEHNVLPIEEEEEAVDISRANPLSLIKKAVDMSLSLNSDKEKENLDE
ncbi:hypothetical protein NDU88_005148 [Pleurodeles waltl]|uniref:Uncharacterized protein n=1 Tax=Pleurodeles waltl TaxID=8319 RepID=A0AAV7NLP0_PLEWA|nr:hypothetical protein NDU88_005148 [Pleurodeles waltl]